MNCLHRRLHGVMACAAIALAVSGCATAVRFRSSEASNPVATATVLGSRYHGIASYYHDSFHGRRTASGEIFRQDELVAAHPSLPFGTLVRVTNVRNGRSVVVRITDRGPHVAGRILDVSRAAAEQLGMIAEGLAEIEITILELPQ